MSSVDPFAEPDSLNSEQAELVRQHLREVLSSAAFAGSKRTQEFLQLVVEHALADRVDSLRERMIGAEMFGRPIDYDTANDAVVRVKATDVRRRLAHYYRESVKEPLVRIELPVGSYVPRFLWAATDKSVSASASREDSRMEVGLQFPRVSLWAWVLAIGAVVLVVAGYIGFQKWRNPFPNQDIRSIAILPLVNLSGDPNQEYFADGMTEELIAALGQVPALRVISRTSSMTYKGTKKTLPEIARELRVDGIVEGSIGREGNRVRVITQLVDSRSDQHIWAHSYDRDMTSVLELQSDVARAITDEIRIELTPQERARLNRAQRVNPGAVELYLQGIQRLNSGNPSAAIELLSQAINKDPGYAAAHAAIAGAYGWMGEAGWMPYDQAFSKQKAEALKAIELDDSRPEPHLELGVAAMNQNWDWGTQRKEFERALQLNPNAAVVHWAYANHLNRVGRVNEAISEAKLALQLDPVSSRSYMNTSFIYYFARQYDQAQVQIERAVAMHPDAAETPFPLGIILVEKGQFAQAIREFQKLGDLPHALGHMGNAYAREGREAEALAILPRLRRHTEKTGIGRYEIALVYAGLKEKEKAFEWLERAYQARDKGLTYLLVDPCLDPLRSDPRFNSLVERIGFPAT
jgi:TolB-like protein/Tfp pilus assembly protein PilF